MDNRLITVNQLFNLLKTHYQRSIEDWWPHESKHEIVIGAFLVQNTTWHNVELSLNQIRQKASFSPKTIRQLSQQELKKLIHSSGFHENKSRNILEFFEWTKTFEDQYDKIKAHFGPSLRKELLKRRGIGPETADVLLMYVFNEPVFIADNYARRLFQLLKAPVPLTYPAVKQFAENNGELTVAEWAAFHGWIIQFAQQHLRPNQKASEHFLNGYQLIANHDNHN